MKLSVELYNEIITSLRSDGTCGRVQNKRTQARVGLRCALNVIACSPGTVTPRRVTIQVHDLSQSGCGLTSPIRLEKGSAFVAHFLRDGHPPVPILYKIRHCRQISEEMFSVGALFQQVLPDETGQVLSLGKKPPMHRMTPKAA